MEEGYIEAREWTKLVDLKTQKIDCGFCGEKVSSHFGYTHAKYAEPKIYICPNCGCPSFFDLDLVQHPGPKLGREIEHLPDDIQEVYDEIRDCIKVNCNTAAILLGRKLLMHLAVNKAESKVDNNFKQHMNNLKNKGFVPPNGNKLVEFIRDIGNEHNHQIIIGEYEQAEKMLRFIEMLLLFMYEMTGIIDE
jgi:hypothetical protein